MIRKSEQSAPEVNDGSDCDSLAGGLPDPRLIGGTAPMASIHDKIRQSIQRLADSPESGGFAPDGQYWQERDDFFDIGNWTSSFHTGMAVLAGLMTGDEFYLDQTLRLAPVYELKVGIHGADTMHDLGFLYSLYSVPLHQITGDAIHRETGLRAARLLAARSSRASGTIRAWGRMDGHDPNFEGLAIIDCMMNLPLLHWAARESGEASFTDIAIRHAEATRLHFVRSDGSVCHAFRFDETSGAPLRQDNFCGHAADSHWARGTAWAIYGFALSFRHTGIQSHLETALRLAREFISMLGPNGLPPWDFRLPAGVAPIPDTSAAAIAVCGIGEILEHVSSETALKAAGDALLSRLCQPDCLDENPAYPGILRKAQIGTTEMHAVHAYSSWGDYFLMEALARKGGVKPTWW